MTQDSIPTVDLEDLATEDPARLARADAAIREGLGEYGLIYVAHHGVDMEALERFYAAYIELTERPLAEKQRLAGTAIWFQRGWTPPNTEKAVVSAGQPDFKECYFAATEPLDPVCKMQYPEIYADNIWPEGATAFRQEYEKLGHHVHTVGIRLLRACARALGLDQETFVRMTQGAAHVSRALRYLPLTQSQIDQNVLWGEEHTDFNLLTLLPGGRFFDPQGKPCARPDDASGLYLRTRPTPNEPEGRRVLGTTPPGCIVVQVGQALEMLTGGAFLATPHEITAPKTPGYSRTAFAHFVHVHAHEVLYPLEPFRTEDAVRAYSPPVLAGTYGIKTLVDIALAPSSALEKLGYRHYDRLAQVARHRATQS